VQTRPSSGDIYMSGSFSGSTLTVGSTTFTNAGGTCSSTTCQDNFLTKMDSDGNTAWATSWGNALYSEMVTIAVDPNSGRQ
jgi:hypothetical protein